MGRHLKDCMIYAVDFDGTLCENKFPEIGAPNNGLIEWLIKRQKAGDKIVLWTNRIGKYLEDAVAWSAKRGLFFDAVNENAPGVLDRYKDILKDCPPSPKISADIFIDDAACGIGLPFNKPGCEMQHCWNMACKHRKVWSAAIDVDVPDKSVYDLGLSARTENALGRAGIMTLYVLIARTEHELEYKVRGLGRKSIEEIKAVLAKHSLKLQESN